MAGEHVLRVLLALGDVGLVERIDAHDCPRDGGCELPAEKLLAEIVSVLERQPHHGVPGGREGAEPCLGRIVLLTRKRERYEDTVAPVHLGRPQRLFGDGQDPLPLLAGALRDQLLDPQPEAPDPPRQDERGLVAARQCGFRENGPEPRGGVLACRNPRGASLGHAMRPVQQLAHVDADQGRRDEPEIGQGGIATADVRGVQEGAAKSSLPGEPSERCIGVGNGDELCAPAARLLPEVAVQAVGLLRRPGLARNEEQRARDVLASERGDHGTRVGAVEHRERRVARLAAERAPQHLRRQTRAPHATQHDAVELLSYLLGERRQCFDLLRHHLAHVEPTQPVADLGCSGVSLPDGRVAAPNPLGHVGVLQLGEPPRHGLVERPQLGGVPRRCRRHERLALRGDHAKQRLEGVGELLDALRFEHAGDVPEVDRGRPEVMHDALRVRGVAGKGFSHGAVVFEQLERLGR